MSGTILPFGSFLDNEAPHNFAKLAREFLDAAKFTHMGFQSVPMWPTYYLVFQSLENFLKAFLLAHGATIDHFSYASKMGALGGNWRLWPDLLSPEAKSRYNLSDPYKSKWGADVFK